MRKSSNTYDRLTVWAVIGVSVAGIAFFGYRSVTENTRRSQGNPYEYNIDSFMQFDTSLLKYAEIRRIPLPFRSAQAIAIDDNDNLYVAVDDSLAVFNSDAVLRSTLPAGGVAQCIAVCSDGRIFLGMTDHVEVLGRDGARQARWASLGEKAYLTSVAVTEERVYAADAGNRIVHVFDMDGIELSQFGGRDETRDIPGFIIPSRFFDVAIDPDGFLWAANTGLHSLENYASDGDLRSSWGVFSMDIEGFCGCCNPVHFAIVSDGSFITAEKGIPRVKVYDCMGHLESVVAGPDSFAEGTEGLDIAVDYAGRIYVLDPVRKHVKVFERNAE